MLRLPELAALVAIGIRRRTLARLILIESMLLTTVGTVIGIAASEALRRAIGWVPQAGDYPIRLVLSPIVPLVGLGLGLLIGFLGGIVPSFAVRRVDVMTMLR
jgi:putative ABC transport system permease protein